MRLTRNQLISMKNETTSKQLFRWDMGDTYIIVFPKAVVNPETNEFYEPMPSEQLRIFEKEDKIKELLATGKSQEEAEREADEYVKTLTDESLNIKYGEVLDIPSFGNFMRKFDNRNGETNVKGSQYFNGNIVATGHKVDGVYQKDILDELLSISSPIMKAKVHETEVNYANVPQTVLDSLVKGVKETKPIGSKTIRVAVEILAIHTDSKFKVKDSYLQQVSEAGDLLSCISVKGVKSYINSCIAVYGIKKFMKASDNLRLEGYDDRLDYLALAITYPSDTKGSKAQSGIDAEFKGLASANVKLENQIPNFTELYKKYRKGVMFTQEAIEDKVWELRPTPEDKILQYFKTWLEPNLGYLSEDIKESQSELLARVMSSATENDIKEIVSSNTNTNQNVNNMQNTQNVPNINNMTTPQNVQATQPIDNTQNVQQLPNMPQVEPTVQTQQNVQTGEQVNPTISVDMSIPMSDFNIK